MTNIFYNIVSIVVGLILLVFSILNVKKQKLLLIILSFLHSGFFLTAGIGGFFLPEKYQYITILAMLALCITMLISFLLLKKEGKKKKQNANT